MRRHTTRSKAQPIKIGLYNRNTCDLQHGVIKDDEKPSKRIHSTGTMHPSCQHGPHL